MKDHAALARVKAEIQAEIDALTPVERAELHADATRLLEDEADCRPGVVVPTPGQPRPTPGQPLPPRAVVLADQLRQAWK